MNKLLIVLLAVCLVSVHAFVKRDAEAPKADNTLETFIKNSQDQFNAIGKQLALDVDTEKIKKGFNEFIENFSETIKNLQNKPKTE